MPETRQSDLRNLAWMDKEGPNMASVVLPTPLGTQSTLVLRSMQQTQSRGPLQSGCSKKNTSMLGGDGSVALPKLDSQPSVKSQLWRGGRR